MLEIIKQCTEAAAAGRIYSIDKTNTHTVHFWANAVASALQKKTDIQEDAYTVVRQNFGKLLTKLLLNSEGYEDLHHFEEIYRKLQEKGVVLSTLAAPLRKLMLHRIDSEMTLNVEEVDLNAQRIFFTSQLWKTFEKRRAVFLLHKAKDEEHGEKRDRLLKLLDSVPHDSVCPATMAQVQMARSLFLFTLPLPTRVTYALGDEVRMRFAADWKSDFDFRSLVYFGTTPETRADLRDLQKNIHVHSAPRYAGLGDESDHDNYCGIRGVFGSLHQGQDVVGRFLEIDSGCTAWIAHGLV